MAKKKNNKLSKDEAGLNKLSRLMLNQNNSLRKLLEELSREEKSNYKTHTNTNPYKYTNSKIDKDEKS